MKKLIVLVGNIGAGKSTLAKKYVKQGYRIISRDAIRYMVGGGNYVFDTNLEPTIKKATKSLLNEFLKSNIDIVYDETNVSKRLRKSTIKLAKKYGYRVTAVVLPKISKNVSVRRRLNNPNGDCKKEIWENVWTVFDALFDEPTFDEGIDSILRIT